jgi:hypothetical protein
MSIKDFKKNNYTLKQKQNLVSQLNNTTQEEVIEDFNKLKEIGCNAKNKGLSQIGNKVVDNFTKVERLNTIGRQGINFYDLYYNKSKLITKPYIKKLLDFYKINYNKTIIQKWYRIMNLYFGAITIFRPIVSMEIYCQYKPNTILDFTMGWGGRLVGACALNIKKYIGIDSNINLREPYKNLQKFMNQLSTTKIELHFTDAVKFDYSKIKYDMVLTSPPYYNTETYQGQNKQIKEIWDKEFYEPLFKNTFYYLSKGGYYCLNIP